MNAFTTILASLKEGKSARRKSWEPCRKIRMATESDKDTFMHMTTIEELIVEDCKKACDCAVRVWIQEPGEMEAPDWELIAN